MPDLVLTTGDVVVFDPTFGNAIVVPAPGRIIGQSRIKSDGATVCTEGDEGSVVVPGVQYTSPPFVIPGTGTLRIASLAADQRAQKAKSDGRRLLLRGSNFAARLTVDIPAMQPSPSGPPIPDGVTIYSGTGRFVAPPNRRAKAS